MAQLKPSDHPFGPSVQPVGRPSDHHPFARPHRGRTDGSDGPAIQTATIRTVGRSDGRSPAGARRGPSAQAQHGDVSQVWAPMPNPTPASAEAIAKDAARRARFYAGSKFWGRAPAAEAKPQPAGQMQLFATKPLSRRPAPRVARVRP